MTLVMAKACSPVTFTRGTTMRLIRDSHEQPEIPQPTCRLEISPGVHISATRHETISRDVRHPHACLSELDRDFQRRVMLSENYSESHVLVPRLNGLKTCLSFVERLDRTRCGRCRCGVDTIFLLVLISYCRCRVQASDPSAWSVTWV